jgi:hypothetical protein
VECICEVECLVLECGVHSLDEVIIVIGQEYIRLAYRHRLSKTVMVEGLMHVSVLAIDERFTILAHFGIGRIKIHECIRRGLSYDVVGISVVYIPVAYVVPIVYKV